MKDKEKTMAQWNKQQLLLLCENSGAIALALLGFPAGWMASR